MDSIWESLGLAKLVAQIFNDKHIYKRISSPNLIRELCNVGSSGDFDNDKTRDLVKEIYFWSSTSRDVLRLVEGCVIC